MIFASASDWLLRMRSSICGSLNGKALGQTTAVGVTYPKAFSRSNAGFAGYAENLLRCAVDTGGRLLSILGRAHATHTGNNMKFYEGTAKLTDYTESNRKFYER